jgi:hypothetical protein
MKKIPIISLAGGIVFFLFYFVSLPVLVLEKKGEIIFLRHIKPGDTFFLGYKHSVAKSDVWEGFLINENYQIVLIQTMFQGQGAGLPYTVTESEKLTRIGDWFKITGMKRDVPIINWRVDAQWQSRFRFDQEKIIPVAALMGDGLVQIKISQKKLIEWLSYYGQNFLERKLEKNERFFS